MPGPNPELNLATPRRSHARSTSWADAASLLEAAPLYWIITLKPGPAPHVAPLVGVWVDGAAYFCTGPTERKARNLDANPRCVFFTGRNDAEGLDVMIEGDAKRVTDEGVLEKVAGAYLAKYGDAWRFVVRDGGLGHAPASIREDTAGVAYAFTIVPTSAFGFAKGPTYSPDTLDVRLTSRLPRSPRRPGAWCRQEGLVAQDVGGGRHPRAARRRRGGGGQRAGQRRGLHLCGPGPTDVGPARQDVVRRRVQARVRPALPPPGQSRGRQPHHRAQL